MFTLGANQSSLGILQAALTTAISGTSSTNAVLSTLQQSETLADLRHLSDLTRPENLSRIAGNPVLFQTVAQALKLPADVERQLFQSGAQAEETAAQPQAATTAAYRPTSCSMDMVGADFSHAAELPEIDTSVPRSSAEIADNIFTVIHQFQGKARISPMEQHIRAYAEQMDLREGVQIYRRTPTAITKKIFQLMDLAVKIAKIMDDDAQGYFRETMHENHSRAVIVQYLKQAREEGPENAVPLLEQALELYDHIYQGGVDLGVLENAISRAVKDELNWPKQIDLTNLGAFAVTLRNVFASRGGELDAQQRYYLMRLAVCLDAAGFGLGAYRPEELGTPEQALKMATLIEVLYGCGFGDERWLAVAERLRGVAAQWPSLGADTGKEELSRFGVLAAHMLEEVKTSYHSLFDSLVRTNGKKWGLSEADIRSFTRSLYRTSALFPLGQHLAALHSGNGNHNRAEQILDRLHHDRRKNRPYAPVFLGEGKKEDFLDMGNKGKGLNELIRMGEAVPAGFALPPVLIDRDNLNDEQLAEINRALDELEKRTGKSFEDGSLKVSVRSGSSVSMPGTLLTITRVSTRHEALRGVLAVYRSWDNPSAQLYRRINGVPEDFGTSVIVQEWIETDDHADSGFGLGTSDGWDSKPLTRYGRQAHGIDLVSGYHPGQDEMDEAVAEELSAKIQNYEDRFRHPVEVEYAVERGKIWMLQIRRAQLNYEDEVRWAIRMIRNNRMPREEGVAFLGGYERLIAALNEPRLLIQDENKPIAAEAKGGGRPLVGSVVFDEAGIVSVQAQGLQAIFVTDNADAGKSAAYAFEAGAAVFNEGNGVSHLEGDLRASNKPHLGGIPVKVDRHARTATIGGVPVREGDVLTLDPSRGAIYRGALPIQEGDSPVASLIRWLMN